MFASCVSSSSGPSSASRLWRLEAEMSRAAFVIVRKGRSARPAISQPSQIESAAMIASAIPELTSNPCNAAFDWACA